MLHFSPETNRSLAKQLHKLNQDLAWENQILSLECNSTELEELHRFAKISIIGASTRIENAVLTDPEVTWIDTLLTKDGKKTSFLDKKNQILNKLSKERERSIEEVAGCRAMLQIIYSQFKDLFPLKESDIKGLHRELLRFEKTAKGHLGKYKKNTNRVIERDHRTGKERVVLEPASPGPITESAMHDLIQWYNHSLEVEPWTVALATEFVFRFLAIHPFQDGNGRLGRGLFLLCLLQSPQKELAECAKYLAIDRTIEKHKETYYSVLHQTSKGQFHQNPTKYNYFSFAGFMVRIISESIKDIEVYRTRYKILQELSPSARKVLSCFEDKPETRLSVKEIIEQTKLPRRTVTDVLGKMYKNNILQRLGKGRGVIYQLVF